MLVRLALNVDGHTPHNIQLAAARDILDRNGIGNTQQIEVLLKPWEQAIEGLLVDTADDDDTPSALPHGSPRGPQELLAGDVIAGELTGDAYRIDSLPSLIDDAPRYSRGNRLS